MSLVKSVFRLFQQHRFLRTSATVNVLRTQSSCRNACTSSGSTDSNSKQTLQLNPTDPENHDPLLLSLLKSCGFSDAQIVELVAKDPRVLESNVAKEPRILKSKVYRNASRSTNSSTEKTVRKLNPAGSENNESVVRSFFKSYGFSDAHVAKIIVKAPQVLKSQVNKTFKPKLDFLADYGMSDSLLHELIADNPRILYRSVDDALQPTLSLLQTCLGSNEKVIAAVKRFSFLLSYGNWHHVENNFNFLVSQGVPMKSISKLIYLKPRIITHSVDRMVRAVKSAKQLGYRLDDPMLVYALDSILSISESTMYKKVELLKNLLGQSEEEVNSLFKRYPPIFFCSEDKIKNVVNFVVNSMQAESSILLDNPVMFGCSVDKKLVPRYNVFKVLELKKLLKKGRTFIGTLRQSEKWFESNCVVKYMDQVPHLMEIYHGFSKTSDTLSVINKMTS